MTRPWRLLAGRNSRRRWLLFAFGACLALMNCCFYLAIARLPISLVAAIEFAGSIALALYGLRTRRNLVAVAGAAAGIECLGAAMTIALIVVFPIGVVQAAKAFAHPTLIFAGIGVGVCSSVIPYICDQLALSHLPRATFALLLTLLPASAAIIGAIVLAQIPSPRDLLGIALVMAGLALHRSVVDAQA